MMRCYLGLLLLLLYHVMLARSRPSKEEDGFHRLLRRSAISDKFDRPLVREERNIEEDFENEDDAVVTRNRRSNEDKFYQTLLSRAESKQQDKRSFDTEDSDNKAGFIIREDWTGDSKISDADRQELENLFNTLNPGEEDQVKNDEVREINIEDEPGSVEGAAKDYTKWLMTQKPSKFTKSLTHKVEVDHQLSKMFYKSSLPAVAAQKKPVSASTAKAKKPTLRKAAAKNVKANVRFGIAQLSQLPAVCNDNTPHCICMRACAPRPVTSASPCNCGMPAPPPPAPAPPPASAIAKTASTKTNNKASFAKPCDEKDAKCLCARTCYPRPVANANPCDCGMPPAPAPAPPPASLHTAKPGAVVAKAKLTGSACKPNDAKCLCARNCHPKPVARVSPCDCGMPPAPAPAPPPAPIRYQPAKPAAAACKPNDAKCLCARACHPKPVSRVSPCDCGMPPAPAPAPPPAGFQVAKAVSPVCKPNDAKCLCARACHPKPVSRVSPCDCGMPPAPAPAPPPAGFQVAKAVPPVCMPSDAKCLCARACHPKPVSRVSPCDCGMPPAPAPAPAPPPAPAVAATSADSKSNTPAVAWCASACRPRHVLTSSPCQCHPSEPETAPVRQPKPVPQARDDATSICARSCHPRPVSNSSPCSCGLPSPSDKLNKYPISAPVLPLQSSNPQAQSAPIQVATQASVQGKLADSQGPARSSVAAKKKTDESQPISDIQSALTNAASLNKDEYFDKSGEKLTYLNTRAKNYQGCYKDKKPGRDLPRRFTRYAMTPEVCLRECKYQGYNFAGLQYSYLCFCGNAFGRYGKVDDAFCNSRCLGDNARPCGAFWHNSVYSVDAREYDPTDFDFRKVDADETRKDAVAQKQGFDVNKFSSSTKANVANNLVKAAEAALKAAKKLLPDSKNKALTRKWKGGKHKREDDEDPELEEMKLSAMASLKAAKKYLKKTQVVDPAKHKEKEKRSIEVGDDSWVNLDNGKDLLVAYLGGIDDYRRQTRSVDDEDEEDLEADDEKPKFEYRRMTLGASGDGEFINRFEDDVSKSDDKSKRAVSDNDLTSDIVKVLSPMSAAHAGKPSKRQIADAGAQTRTANATEVSNSTASGNTTAASNETAASNTTALNGTSANATSEVPSNNTASASLAPAVAPGNASLTAASLPTNATSLPANATLNANSATERTPDVKTISVSAEKSISIRKRRSLDEEEEPEADGVKKMAARGEINSEKKTNVQTEVKRQVKEDISDDDVNESDFAKLLNEETDAEKAVEHAVKRSARGSENREIEADFTPTQTDKQPTVVKRSTESKDKNENIQLRSHVEKGVEKLMALVINLYKEQSTIKGFEDSVHDLKDDIATQLKMSPDKRDEVMKDIRSQIQSTAANKLKDLTSSIRDEIKSYAKSHPVTDKKAETAINSIPDLPLSDADYSRARREISKRGAELDDVENQFEVHDVPSILKEHFKRNAEETEFKGEKMLSRNHRNVPEDDKLDDELSEIIES